MENEQMKNQKDVAPGAELEKIINSDEEKEVKTGGTGSNRPVQTPDSVVVEKREDKEGHDKDETIEDEHRSEPPNEVEE